MSDDKENIPTEEKKESLPELIKKMEEANAKKDELLRREEELAARNIIAGKSLAGEQLNNEPKEDSPKEYAKKVLKGEIKFS